MPPQASFVVDVVVNLLAGRADAAAILATVASRIAPPAEPLQASPLQQPDVQPDMQPASGNASPPTVRVLGERTRAQRDAELRMDAFDLSSISSSVASGSSLTPTVKQAEPCAGRRTPENRHPTTPLTAAWPPADGMRWKT